MAQILDATPFPVPGGKHIDEFAGRISTGHSNVSVAHMTAPEGWSEPAQLPEFDEVTYVIAGSLQVEDRDETVTVDAGQVVLSRAGEWVRYSAGPDGAEYLAVCVPAFDVEAAHRAE
jgi:mannose-6-phosphate isomerase-like protein (cupin superfamily)